MHTGKLSSKSQVTLTQRSALGAKPGDLIGYEIQDDIVFIKRIAPFDAAFHRELSNALNEWMSAADDEAYRGL